MDREKLKEFFQQYGLAVFLVAFFGSITAVISHQIFSKAFGGIWLPWIWLPALLFLIVIVAAHWETLISYLPKRKKVFVKVQATVPSDQHSEAHPIATETTHPPKSTTKRAKK